MMRKLTQRLISATLALALAFGPTFGATLLPPGEFQFTDSTGAPLAAGSVAFYVPGTLTPKTTWADPNGVTPNSNPVTLDGSGRAIVYGLGAYREIVKDANGVTIWDQLTADTTGPYTAAVTGAGTANAQTVTYTTPPPALAVGQTYCYIPSISNTLAATLKTNADNVAHNVYKPSNSGPVPTTGGELVSGLVTCVAWDGTEYQIITSSLTLNNVTTNIVMNGAAINEAQTTLASAGTVAIGAAPGNSIKITGTTTITAFDTVQAGTVRRLEFQSAGLVLTNNNTSLALPGGVNIVTGAGDVAFMESQGSGNWKCLGYFPVTGLPVASPRGYISGLTLSNDGVTPNSVLDIAPGQAQSSINTQLIIIAGITKSTAGSWVAGTGANGMGNGLTIAPSTWYHVCATLANGVGDAWFDTSASCANAPAGTLLARRIGSFLTDGASHIVTFVQLKDHFLFGTPVQDYHLTNPSTSASLQTLTVPLGVKTYPIHNTYMEGDSSVGESCLLYTSPDQADTAPSLGVATMCYRSSGTMGVANNLGGIWTNTSSQIRIRNSLAAAALNVYGTTLGWIDPLQ